MNGGRMENSALYLQLRQLRKSYDGSVNVIQDINLDIKKGEFISFLGPSGSGKTTTLMMIAGFERPDSGDILLAGKSLLRVKPYRRNVGMVFQNYALFPHLTVSRNVAYPLVMRGANRTQIATKVQQFLDLVELGNMSERRPAELSGGQQQRVALARALIFEPDVLLLDEPLGALDKQLREQMQIEIKRIHNEIGVTTIYVTHDQSEAMTLSDRIAVFNNGAIEQFDSPTEMYHRPKTHFVGSFIGDSNFLKAQVISAANGELYAEGLGRIRTEADLSSQDERRFRVLVRPEMIEILSDDQNSANAFDMTIESTINYGDSILLVGKIGSMPLRVRSSGRRSSDVRPGQIIRVGWNTTDMHLIPYE